MILNQRRRYVRRRSPREEADLHRMNVYIAKGSWQKADLMAGGSSLGMFVQELIEREYGRRERRMVQQVENPLKPEETVTSSAQERATIPPN